ncbi:hypothetical protein MishRS11D_18060 [Methylomagnum ishizawai]|nr:hypothetical protein MishRS11D_18060 [Methylomagnum ishizawai]
MGWLYPSLKKNILARWVWRWVKWVAATPPCAALIDKLAQANSANPRDGLPREVLLPLIDIDPRRGGQKKALVVVPYVTDNAYFNLVEYLDKTLIDLGYDIHAVVHNGEGIAARKPWWTSYYYVRATTGKFLSLYRDKGRKIPIDNHRVDDWCGPELMQFVAALHGFLKFDLCVVHYVFFSKVFEVFDHSVAKWLVTHDVYSERNARLLRHDLERSLWFSTTLEEEKKGLMRADQVFAIQEAEADFFAGLVGRERVVTLPWMPAKRYIQRQAYREKPILGYLASDYLNNVKVFEDFYRRFAANPVLAEHFNLWVGGRICTAIEKRKQYPKARFCGVLDEVGPFYAQCDLMVNPDFFESGLKLKGIEALAYGMPLVTTIQATRGLGLTDGFHTCADLDAVCAALEAIAQDHTLLGTMAEASRRTYDNLCVKYDAKRILERVIADHGYPKIWDDAA